ncbi:hypothetical protein SDC9_124024 [bioreactor metagenome]|uniref:Uncharacterized protein n=1 Tax=bioreactor metagenome TaxID=1076179 RepID=A0A645CJA2_9ZZZZ
MPGRVVVPEKVHDDPQGDRGGLNRRVTEDSGGDAGKVHGLDAVLRRKLETGAVAGGQLFCLAGLSAPPDRARRVEDIACLQPVSLCQLCLAGGTAVERAALRQKLRPRRPVDSSVHTAAPQQGFICGVDNGLGVRLRNIPHYDGKTVHIRASFRNSPYTSATENTSISHAFLLVFAL